MNRIIFAVGFTLGTGFGAVGTWALMRKKYEEKLNAQIQACLAQLSSKEEQTTEDTDENSEDTEEDKPPKPIKKLRPDDEGDTFFNYQAYYSGGVPKKPAAARDNRDVIVDITEDDYNSSKNEQEFITRFEDGVFADDEFRQITDPVGVFGQSVVDYFNEGDTDTVWVRNLTRGRDYEISYEERTYEDAFPRMYPN